MDANEFIRVVTTFADNPGDLVFAKGRLYAQVREEVIEASVTTRGGSLIVTEAGSLEVPAETWIVSRLARVPQLADRILSYVGQTEHYVPPRGSFEDDVNASFVAEDQEVDVGMCMREVLSRRPAGTATVLYLTSDAGEGKTTVIGEVARAQAQAYKRREADWLLIPISLGGRPFMRFDDVVIGALVNKLRFPFFYYDAFVELVRMGVLVPAFDGFEEVFIEGASGEALSALGGLVKTLNSSGSMLISARKAYFEYREFGQTARLFDAVGSDSVSFSRLALQRWRKYDVIAYGRSRGIADSEEVYARAASRLGSEHPILTRAVVVKRLFDVAETVADSEVLLNKLGTTSRDYFVEFVSAIIEREANEKWTDRSGKVARPLLDVVEHHQLLSMVAMEMWIGGADSLPQDVVEVVAEVFAEQKAKTPAITRQVKERLKQHALLAFAEGPRGSYSFDHEDFRKFFLGQAIATAICTDDRAELQSALRKGALPTETVDSIATFAKRRGGRCRQLATQLAKTASTDSATSFARENVGAITLRMLDGDEDEARVSVGGLTFPVDALRDVKLRHIEFSDCFFQRSSTEHSFLEDCRFVRCRFERLELFASATIRNTLLDECEVAAVGLGGHGLRMFDPEGKERQLKQFGFAIGGESASPEPAVVAAFDERSVLVERAFRLFLRNTHVNEEAFRARLGVRGTTFVDEVLPMLVKAGVVDVVDYRGAGRQRRFRLAVPMKRIEEALRTSAADFEELLASLSS